MRGPWSHTGAGRALATLCENYWFPLYAFVRRAGHAADEAQDLTQAFFAEPLAKDVLAVADPQRGKFRSFLQAAIKHFLAKKRRGQEAQKRGGHKALLSLDFDSGENRYRRIEPATSSLRNGCTKTWALALLDFVSTRLREEFGGRQGAAVRSPETIPCRAAGRCFYRALSKELGMTEGAVKVGVHRMRRRIATCSRKKLLKRSPAREEFEGTESAGPAWQRRNNRCCQ